MTTLPEPESTQPVSLRAVLNELRKLSDDDGSLGLTVVRRHLEKRAMDASPEAFMEQAEPVSYTHLTLPTTPYV